METCTRTRKALFFFFSRPRVVAGEQPAYGARHITYDWKRCGNVHENSLACPAECPNKEPTSSSLQSRNILSPLTIFFLLLLLSVPLVCSTPNGGKKERKKEGTYPRRVGMPVYFAYVMDDSLTRFKIHPTIQGPISCVCAR